MLGVLWHPRGLVSLLTGCQWWDIDESSAGYCLGTARLKHQLAKAVWTQLIRLKNGKTKLVRASNRRKQVFSVFENIKTALLDQTIGLSGLAFQSSHGAGLEVWWDCKNREHIRSNTSLRYPLSLQQLWLGGFLSQKWFLCLFSFLFLKTLISSSTGNCRRSCCYLHLQPSVAGLPGCNVTSLVQVSLVRLLFFPVGLWFAWPGGQPVLMEWAGCALLPLASDCGASTGLKGGYQEGRGQHSQLLSW